MKNMETSVLLLVTAVSLLSAQAAMAFDTSVMSAKCDANPIPSGSPFWGNLGTILHQLVDNTAYADYDFKTQYGGGNCPAYGEATCSQSISPQDCTDCLSHLSNDIWRICNSALGAKVQYGDCCIRYEQYRF